MTKKLLISPDTSYVLGIYRCNNSYRNLYLETSSKELVERFVKILVMNLETRTDAIRIIEEEDFMKVEVQNSKLKKLLDNALDERDRIFKYKNEYSASYFAGIFDCNGAADKKGVFVRGINSYDKILLERIGFHTGSSAGKCYIRKNMDFMMFIAPFSIKAKIINKSVVERDRR
jgi:hypothetical protein